MKMKARYIDPRTGLPTESGGVSGSQGAADAREDLARQGMEFDKAVGRMRENLAIFGDAAAIGSAFPDGRVSRECGDVSDLAPDGLPKAFESACPSATQGPQFDAHGVPRAAATAEAIPVADGLSIPLSTSVSFIASLCAKHGNCDVGVLVEKLIMEEAERIGLRPLVRAVEALRAEGRL